MRDMFIQFITQDWCHKYKNYRNMHKHLYLKEINQLALK